MCVASVLHSVEVKTTIQQIHTYTTTHDTNLCDKKIVRNKELQIVWIETSVKISESVPLLSGQRHLFNKLATIRLVFIKTY